MGKRNRNKKKSAQSSSQTATFSAPKRRKRIHRQRDRFLAVAGVLLLGFIVYKWWSFSSFEDNFMTLVEEGADTLSDVRDFPSRGQAHLNAGQSHTYGERFPTSGPHDPWPVDPGFYREIQRPTQLVHSLEHGHIVIYYDEPAPGVLSQLREWAGQYSGPWDGIVIVPKPNLGEEIVLTAWTRLLRQEPFDPAAAAAFIDLYRGRGPENPVR